MFPTGIKSKQGEFTVHIDTAATKSTSAPSDNTSLSGDETLTVTAGSAAASVALTAAMSMSQVVTAINSEMAAVKTQILTGASQLYADSGQASAITAATKWNSIYDGAGLSASLVNGDSLSFSGTTRTGKKHLRILHNQRHCFGFGSGAPFRGGSGFRQPGYGRGQRFRPDRCHRQDAGEQQRGPDHRHNRGPRSRFSERSWQKTREARRGAMPSTSRHRPIRAITWS